MSNPNTLKPFRSGYDPRRNLKGRPVGSKNMKTIIMEVLQQQVGEGKNRKTLEKLLVERIIQLALKGDRQMIKMIWEYRDGKPGPYKGDGDEEKPKKANKRASLDSENERIDAIFAPRDQEIKSAYE